MQLPRPLVLLALGGMAACGRDLPITPLGDTAPRYSFSVGGDRTGVQSGIPLVTYVSEGWSESAGGVTYKSDVTLVLLASDGPRGPQTNIGLLGRAEIGTYRVRMIGAARTALEYYGGYRLTNADGSTTVYDATSGSVTITEVSPVIRGTFSFHSTSAVTWSGEPLPGVPVHSAPASLDLSGSFVAQPIEPVVR